jgi:hypothetical protein
LGGDLGAAIVPCDLNETSFSYFQSARSLIRRITADDFRNPRKRGYGSPYKGFFFSTHRCKRTTIVKVASRGAA